MPYEFPKNDEDDDKPKKRGGRPGALQDMSPQMAHAEAKRLLAQGLSEHAWHVIELLAQSGVLSTEQLNFVAAPSTLSKKYAPRRMVDRLPFTTAELKTVFQEHELTFDANTRLFVLGPVGVELAQMRTGNKPVTGHLAYRLERIMHDVILNEIILRLYRFANQLGWRMTLAGTNEGALYNADYSHKILEPDALITVEKEGDEPRLFCIEYHNEDHRTRAERKIDKYENVRANNVKIWQTTWDTNTFPSILAVFKNRIVGEGYRDKLKTEAVEVQFYGKLLKGVMQDNLAEWVNFTRGERETLFA